MKGTEMGNPAAARQRIFEVHGEVKFYNPNRRFGFVKADDASIGDVLLPERCLEEHGLTTIKQGVRLVCQASPGRKGDRPQVKKIVRFI